MFGFKKEIRSQARDFADAIKAIVHNYDKKIEDLEDEIWKLKNPPKFKVGDKVRGFLVVSVEFKKGAKGNVLKSQHPIPNLWTYICFNSKTKKTETLFENELTIKK